MKQHSLDAWHTIFPERNNPHGPMPGLLVLLTVITGLVDAFSYLELGRVFVANMTGNVVFLGFAAGGAPGFLWWASLLGIATFLLGALFGGRLTARFGAHRGRHLLASTALQAVLMAAGFVAALCFPRPYGHAAVVVLIILVGAAMGLQNATARALSVPDLTTTVLTMTITGISADSHVAGGPDSRLGRRLVSIASMFAGALVGAVMVESGAAPFVLLVATALLAIVTVAIRPAINSDAAWTAKR